MTIVVTIVDQNEAVLKKVRIADHAEIAALIPKLVAALSLPSTDDAGRPIRYHLSYRNTRLHNTQTLQEVEINNGDSLVIMPDMLAGAHGQPGEPELPEPLVVLDSTPLPDSYQPQQGFPPLQQIDAQTESVSIVFQPDIMQGVFAQARGRREEVGGILLGNVYTEQQRLLIVVEQILEAKHTSAGPAHVMFTGDTWQDILRRRATSDLPVVGWYHSHPGFGIFLSPSDEFIQRNFFGNRPWYIALVVDPTTEEWGVFAWEAQQIKRCMRPAV